MAYAFLKAMFYTYQKGYGDYYKANIFIVNLLDFISWSSDFG